MGTTSSSDKAKASSNKSPSSNQPKSSSKTPSIESSHANIPNPLNSSQSITPATTALTALASHAERQLNPSQRSASSAQASAGGSIMDTQPRAGGRGVSNESKRSFISDPRTSGSIDPGQHPPSNRGSKDQTPSYRGSKESLPPGDTPPPKPARAPMTALPRRSSVESHGPPLDLASSVAQQRQRLLAIKAIDEASRSRSSFASDLPASRSNAAGSGNKPSNLSASVLSAGANDSSSGHPGGKLDAVPEVLLDIDLPAPLMRMYRRLGVIPKDTPVPISMLSMLWRTPSYDVTMEIVEAFREHEVLRVAVLDDGTTWCLITSEQLETVQLVYADALPQYHGELMDSYCRQRGGGVGGGGGGLQSVPDDGYIFQHMSHHLIHGNRVSVMRQLLTEPVWIEAKLHAYGAASVVQDFRRYLGARPEDSDMKLILQAVMLCIGSCMENPGHAMLRQQLLARLMSVAKLPLLEAAIPGESVPTKKDSLGSANVVRQASPWLKQWYDHQVSLAAADEAIAAGSILVHLMPRTATLEQAGGLHRMTLRGNSAPVHKVVISPNGRDVVTVSEDGTAQVWDMNVGDCVMQLARDKPLTDVSVAPDGQLSVIACADGNCCVWDLASGEVRHVLRGHTNKVNAVAIDRQGIRCVTASDDGTVRVWSIYDGKCEQVLKGHKGGEGPFLGIVMDVAMSSDGSMAATVSDDNTCRVWDLDEEECLHVMEGHNGWVTSVEFIGTSTELITASHDETARVWDGERGRCLRVLEGHEGRLNKVTVDVGGTFVVTCSDDLTSRVWEIDTGKCLSILKGHEAWISDAAITRGGTHVVTVSGDTTAILWDATSGQKLCQLDGHSEAIRSVVLTYLGRFAVTASDDSTVRVWDLQAPQLTKVDCHVSGKVSQLVPLKDGRRVVSCGEDGVAKVWEAGMGATLFTLEGGHEAPIAHLAVAADGKTVVTGSADRCICTWCLEKGTLISKAPSQPGSRVRTMVFDDLCLRAAILLYDCNVLLVEVASGKTLQHVVKRGEHGASSVVTSLCMTKDGQHVIVCSKDGSYRTWSIRAKKFVAGDTAGHQEGIVCSALSHDERVFATASLDGTVRLSRYLDGQNIQCLPQPRGSLPTLLALSPPLLPPGSLPQIPSLILSDPGHKLPSPSSGLMAIALDSQSVSVLELDPFLDPQGSKSRLRPIILPPHKGEVQGLVFSPSGTLLATWGSECTVRVWRFKPSRRSGQEGQGDQVAFFMADSAISCCCFIGREGEAAGVLAVGDQLGLVHFLDLPIEIQ